MHENFFVEKEVPELGDAKSYAVRLFNYAGTGRDQIAWVVERLRADPECRSAAVTTFQPLTDTAYIPCVSLLDFWIRADAVEWSSTPTASTSARRPTGISSSSRACRSMSQASSTVGRPAVVHAKSAHIYEPEWALMAELASGAWHRVAVPRTAFRATARARAARPGCRGPGSRPRRARRRRPRASPCSAAPSAEPDPERAEDDLEQRDQRDLGRRDQPPADREQHEAEPDLADAERDEQHEIARPPTSPGCANGPAQRNTSTCERQVAGAIDTSRRCRVSTSTPANDVRHHDREPEAERVRPARAADHQHDAAERERHREPGAPGHLLAERACRRPRRAPAQAPA